MQAPCALEGADAARRPRDQARDDARRRVARHAVLGEGTRAGRRRERTARARCGRSLPAYAAARSARARRHAHHAEAHAQPRRLPVARRHRARCRRHRPARRWRCRKSPSRASTFDGARAVRVEDSGGLPALRRALIDGIDPKAPTPGVDEAAAGALRPAFDLRRRRHHQLRDARARPAAARLRRPAARRRGRRALRARGREADAAERRGARPRRPTCCSWPTRRSRSASPASWAASTRASPTTRRACISKARSGIPPSSRARCKRLGFSSDAGYRFERGVDFDGCARAVERATQLIIDICGGRAGPLTDASSRRDLPRRDPVRVRTARVARLLGMTIPADDDRRHAFTRLGLAFTRDGADFVVTPPSHRFDLAIEEDFVEEVARIHGYDKIPAARERARAAHAAAAGSAALAARRSSARWSTLDWQEIVTFSFVSVDAPKRRSIPPPLRSGAQSDRGAPRRHAHDAAAGPDRDACRPTSTARRRACACSRLGRTFQRAAAGLRAAVAPRRARLRTGDRRSNGATPTRDVDFFDVKGDLEALAAPRRLVDRTRRRIPRCIPGARRANPGRRQGCAGWLGELHPRLARALRTAQGARRVRGRSRRR